MVLACNTYLVAEGSIEKFVILYDFIGVMNWSFCLEFLNYKLIVLGSKVKSPKRWLFVLFFYEDFYISVYLNKDFLFVVYLFTRFCFWKVKSWN